MTTNETQAKALEELKMRAIAWLQNQGQILDTDFNLENATQVANELSANLAIESKKKELEETGDYIEFSGDDNCNETCLGWDGISRRCDCGNRRVYWATGYGHTFENPFVYPEAW